MLSHVMEEREPGQRDGQARRYAPTRRALLAGSLAAAVAACEPLGYAAPKQEEDHDVALVRRAIAGEEELVVRYDAVRRRHPRLAGRLDPLAREHVEHLRVLRGRLSRVAAPTVSARPPKEPSVPAAPADATAALAERERVAAAHRLDDILSASPPLAQLLASISACDVVHAALLAEDHRP